MPSMLVWRAYGAGQTEPPLPQHAGAVSRFFQYFRHGHVFRQQGHGGVPPDAPLAGVESGHQGGAGRGAERTACVALGEAHSFGGQPIDVRRWDFLLPVAAEVAITEIIRQDKNDVRLSWLRGSREYRVRGWLSLEDVVHDEAGYCEINQFPLCPKLPSEARYNYSGARFKAENDEIYFRLSFEPNAAIFAPVSMAGVALTDRARVRAREASRRGFEWSRRREETLGDRDGRSCCLFLLEDKVLLARRFIVVWRGTKLGSRGLSRFEWIDPYPAAVN